jgi:hypothetical protein
LTARLRASEHRRVAEFKRQYASRPPVTRRTRALWAIPWIAVLLGGSIGAPLAFAAGSTAIGLIVVAVALVLAIALPVAFQRRHKEALVVRYDPDWFPR